MITYYVLPLNPEPWAIGKFSAGRKNGAIVGRMSPNPNLASFQNAVREELADAKMLAPGQYEVKFYFWRRIVRYVDMSDKIKQRNQADVTNLQKALEDALQGILFENDRDVVDIHSRIIEQSIQANPCIVISLERVTSSAVGQTELPANVLRQVYESDGKVLSPNQWGEDDEF